MDQRFCGHCGSGLGVDQTTPTRADWERAVASQQPHSGLSGGVPSSPLQAMAQAGPPTQAPDGYWQSLSDQARLFVVLAALAAVALIVVVIVLSTGGSSNGGGASGPVAPSTMQQLG